MTWDMTGDDPNLKSDDSRTDLKRSIIARLAVVEKGSFWAKYMEKPDSH